ncbi:MAG: CvpA family protein [Rikenellaceae bacterium]
MNTLDIVICAILFVAAYNGWRQGVIIQVCSLAGIFVALWLGSALGATVGKMIGLSSAYSGVGGFIIVFVIITILLTIAAQLARRFIKFVGFGLLDVLLGVGVSIVKYLIVLSIVLSCVDALNGNNAIISRKSIAGSSLYRPIINLGKHFKPMYAWAEDQIDNRK